MEIEEQRKDWLFRYNTVYKKRHSYKQKSKFLRSLSTDLQMMDKDFKIIEYETSKNKKDNTRNVYIGDIKKAKKIVCTYYDTPSNHFGPYHYFDVKKNGKQTIRFTILCLLIYLILGIIATIWLMSSNFELWSWHGILIILFYFVYFYIFSKYARGIPRGKNLIQNTSSVVTLLDYINNNQNRNKVAFAFLDKGTTNKEGLNQFLTNIKGNTKVMYLDSIGAASPLEIVNPKKIIKNKEDDETLSFMTYNHLNYLLAKNSDDKNYSLTKSQLNLKKLNTENSEQTHKIIDNFLKG